MDPMYELADIHFHPRVRNIIVGATADFTVRAVSNIAKKGQRTDPPPVGDVMDRSDLRGTRKEAPGVT
jgi:hypothetical protein